MALISLKQGLSHAQKHGYALGAFNALDSHFINAIFSAGLKQRAPFILNIAEVHFKYLDLPSLVATIKAKSEQHDLPVILNLDHGLTFDNIMLAIRLGFTSVMFDGSSLSYDENIRQTQEVVRMCHAIGISVEAELGAVGGDEGGALYGAADAQFFTDPLKARDFVAQTNIDALAVAIGNAHGKYKGEPKLDFVRLEKIRDEAGIPLVLHGGSGISTYDFKQAILLGIHKINFYTGMSQAALESVKQSIQTPNEIYDELPQLLIGIEKAIEATVIEQMIIFDSTGKA
ncbi:fructose-bisphosphate aldolase class II [Gammaproteobacteria bacterium]|nr:fructose-bisphosphate aldolase class II [Gammaproteobacteria bacterium]